MIKKFESFNKFMSGKDFFTGDFGRGSRGVERFETKSDFDWHALGIRNKGQVKGQVEGFQSTRMAAKKRLRMKRGGMYDTSGRESASLSFDSYMDRILRPKLAKEQGFFSGGNLSNTYAKATRGEFMRRSGV